MKKVIAVLPVLLVVTFCAGFLFLNKPSRAVSPYQPEDLIGWTPKANFQRPFTQEDLVGDEYHVNFRTYADGGYLNIFWATRLPVRSWRYNLRSMSGDATMPDAAFSTC